MVLRSQDPFAAPLPGHLDPKVNPFYSRLCEASDQWPLFFGPKLRGMAGNWRSVFPNHSPSARVFLEIGSHLGSTICHYAAKHPEDIFIGMDVTFKRVFSTMEKAYLRGLNNVASVLCNGRNVSDIFAPGEIEGCMIFFPDPWTKKKKHRLIQPGFSEDLSRCLSDGAPLWFKTDDLDYFGQSFQVFTNSGLVPCEFSQSAFKDFGNFETTFERKFRLLGTPKNEFLFKKI